MLKVVLGGMGLTGGHHPRREAGASLTSPTAPASALSGLSLLLLPRVTLTRVLADCLPVLSFSSPARYGLLATPTQAQVVPATSKQRTGRSLAPTFHVAEVWNLREKENKENSWRASYVLLRAALCVRVCIARDKQRETTNSRGSSPRVGSRAPSGEETDRARERTNSATDYLGVV